jgi:hypothetical protein
MFATFIVADVCSNIIHVIMPGVHTLLLQNAYCVALQHCRHGFYYSLTNNFFLNVRSHYVSKGKLLPGQQNVSQTEFEEIALAQVTELWERCGASFFLLWLSLRSMMPVVPTHARLKRTCMWPTTCLFVLPLGSRSPLEQLLTFVRSFLPLTV